MPLTENEKARIVDEETLRHETRKNLSLEGGCTHGKGCRCGRCRVCLWILLIIVAAAIFHSFGWNRGWCGYSDEAGYHRGMMDRWHMEPRAPQGPAPETAPVSPPSKAPTKK